MSGSAAHLQRSCVDHVSTDQSSNIVHMIELCWEKSSILVVQCHLSIMCVLYIDIDVFVSIQKRVLADVLKCYTEVHRVLMKNIFGTMGVTFSL